MGFMITFGDDLFSEDVNLELCDLIGKVDLTEEGILFFSEFKARWNSLMI